MQTKNCSDTATGNPEVMPCRDSSQVLLVDDDKIFIKILQRQLETLGFSATSAADNGQIALQLKANADTDFALIFFDLKMPVMDGVEFLRNLAASHYRGELVLMSGEGQRVLQSVGMLAKSHGQKILGVLHKPFNITQLHQIIKRKKTIQYSLPISVARCFSPWELQSAILQGDLFIVYQPKVALASGAIVGVEALVRWQHKEYGMISPVQFINVAERYGLIEDLTLVVLNQALLQAKMWRNLGIVLHVSVNVSMDNLVSLEFPTVVENIALEADVPLSCLILEVTESRLMSNPLTAIDILTRLRLKGVKLSIDDFGTGYSSLVQLRDIPFDELKIDRSFVHGAYRDKSLMAILEANLCMARKMGITSVAEGIADKSDWDFLRSLGCDLAQGYYIAKPMLADQLANWILSGACLK